MNKDAPSNKFNKRQKHFTDYSRIISALKYSYAGFRRVILESAFQQEIIFFAAIVLLFVLVGAAAANYLIASVLFLILAAVETLNTALENIVDKLSPKISEFGKHTKDLGSFAVFCLLIANGAFALYVIVTAVYQTP